MTEQRKYKCKDVEMLLASKTIVISFEENLEDLSMVRGTWTQEFATELKSKIDYGMEELLGLDTKKELRDATSMLHTLQEPAVRKLSFFKKQVEVDFDSEAPEIIKSLGFPKNMEKIHNGNQESLIQLLFAYKKGMTPELKQRIIERGTAPQLIDRIIGFANSVTDANVAQESLKGISKETTADMVVAFNEIYEEVIGICKIASAYFQFDALKKDLFTFSKVLANMGTAHKVGLSGEELQ